MASPIVPSGINITLLSRRGKTVPDVVIGGVNVTDYLISYSLDFDQRTGSVITLHLRVGEINREAATDEPSV